VRWLGANREGFDERVLREQFCDFGFSYRGQRSLHEGLQTAPHLTLRQPLQANHLDLLDGQKRREIARSHNRDEHE
jgi:hypothetical protein